MKNMEGLEKKANEVLLEKKNSELRIYPGLVLLEDTNYHSGTSIKYWM